MPIKFTHGVSKLGASVGTYSREVGKTCPSDCPFLTGKLPNGEEIPEDTRCYANTIMSRWPSVRKNWSSHEELPDREEFAQALCKETLFRLFVGGDSGKDGKFDPDYWLRIVAATNVARYNGWKGKFWLYTHFWKDIPPHLLHYAKTAGISCYASCHTTVDAEWAAEKGWLVALDLGNVPPKSGFTERAGLRLLNCPEQVKGKKKVRCETCTWCPRGAGHVAFFRHR